MLGITRLYTEYMMNGTAVRELVKLACGLASFTAFKLTEQNPHHSFLLAPSVCKT